MATVFLAEDLKHRRRVAIKVLDPEVAAAIGPERFLREIGTIARLAHPHILALFDSGEAGGLLYFVMPYVEGESLRARLWREKQLPLDDALRLTREVADALGYAHGHGVVHRDVKPENILLEEGHAVVADFGIARAAAAADTETLTTTGLMVGTPAYMSPEQAAGSHEVDGRSDQYSLGCMLYEMLAGQPPFTGPTLESLVRQHLSVSPRSVTDLRPAVPAAVTAALQRALAKTPADRFASTGDFAAALGRHEGAPSDLLEAATTAARTPPPPAPKPHRARRVAFAAALVVAITALAAWQQWWPFGGTTARPVKKEWILVAEFDGPPGEPDVARAVQGLAAAALDQSGIVMTVPRDQLKTALEQAGRPDTLRVDGPLARELAYRNAIRAVLEGRVSRVGAGYSVVLRLSDSGNDSTLITVSGSARDGNTLIPALDRLVRRMRRELGEHPAAVRATRDLWEVITPSLEAYRKQEQASDYWNETQDGLGSLQISRDALALDPDCAVAYAEMSVAYYYLGRPDSAVWACDQALMRPQRLTDEQRLHTEARRAFYRADFDAASQALDRQLQLFPSGSKAASALNERALIHAWSRRFAQALEDSRESVARRPIAPNNTLLGVLCSRELAAGQLNQAELTLSRLRGWPRQTYAVHLAVARDDWARAESLSANPPTGLSADPRVQKQAAAVTFAVRARRGEIRSALEDRSPESFRSKLFLAVVSGTAVPAPPSTVGTDTTVAGVITRTWYRSAAGDLSAARRGLADLRRHSADDLARAGAAAVFLEASIAAGEGRWSDVIRLIGPVALRGDDLGPPQWGRIRATPERWLVADAWDHVGPPDSAAAAFERVLETPEVQERITFSTPYAHQRLVMIYARMGRREEAERHWQAFSAVFTNPDPEVKHLLDEARAAVMSLRAMAPRRG